MYSLCFIYSNKCSFLNFIFLMFLAVSIVFEFLALVLHNQIPSSNLSLRQVTLNGVFPVFPLSLQGNPKIVL